MREQELNEAQREGLFHGQHGVDLDLGLERLNKQQELNLVAVGRAMNTQVSELRAALLTAQREAAVIRQRFQILEVQTSGAAPSIIWPGLGLILSVAFTIGDCLLLAPLLQGIGLVDPWTQRLVALFMSAGLTAFAHLGFRQWQIGNRLRAVVTLAIVALAVGSICWWRCDEITYAASLGNEAWRGFLAAHPMSTRLFVVTLSVILPFAAGFTSSHVLSELEFASHWHWARRAAAHGEQIRDKMEEQLRSSEIEARLAAKEIEVQAEIDRVQYRIHHGLGTNGSRNGHGGLTT